MRVRVPGGGGGRRQPKPLYISPSGYRARAAAWTDISTAAALEFLRRTDAGAPSNAL